MGEVYRATDTKLKRDVAIKVLPDDVAEDPERLARFEREAHVLASLNHPHIASIYGLEESGGVPCLVLELVEGQTLAERLGAGAPPVANALGIARQVASALEAAHEKGVIHRDLKPANVKITPGESVKVLDFGLAKALADESAEVSGDPSHSPTLTAATLAGVILGTAAYMSPEQARGKRVDKRTDIWAFGCVFYEMLTGRQAFPGETASDSIAGILEHEPDWQRLPSTTPLKVRELLERCLRKGHRDRLHDIADARIEIEEVLAAPSGAPTLTDVPSASPGTWLRSLPWAVAALLAVALGGLSWLHFRPAEPKIPLRLSVNLPSTVRLYSAESGLALSPNGTRLVITVDRGGTSQLYLRELGKAEAVPLPGTEDGFNPFFSPDGEWVGYTDSGGARLMKVSVGGGSPIVVCDGVKWGSGSWGLDDLIIYTKEYSSGLWRVPASGGTPEMLTTPDSSQGELGHWWPQILPGGREVLYTSYRSPVDEARIVVHSLEKREQKVLAEGAIFGRYVPTGYLLYARGTTVFATPFDAEKLEATGPPVPVLDDVAHSPAMGWSPFSIAWNGTLAFVSDSVLFPPQNLMWVGPDGTEQAVALAPQHYLHPRLSPDGRRLALSVSEDVWLCELSRGSSTRLTSEKTSENFPVWTADGKRVIYRKEQPQYDLYWRSADGSGPEELLYSTPYDKQPSDVSPDGKALVFHETHPDTRNDIWLLSFEGDREPRPLVRTPFTEGMATFSPDGRRLAYVSNESGRCEVYAQAFPGPGGKERISIDGATASPVWSQDGKELFYLNGPKMMAVSIDRERGLMAGSPRVLFEGQYESERELDPTFDVAPDGRFLMVKVPPELAPRQINVVLNWSEELKRLVPTE
jgi:serine/threonine-protein kinase